MSPKIIKTQNSGLHMLDHKDNIQKEPVEGSGNSHFPKCLQSLRDNNLARATVDWDVESGLRMVFTPELQDWEVSLWNLDGLFGHQEPR